ncbi:putative cysteine proteinase CG12163 [Danaus plexippus]|uniref:putative cysteine proteinase CG12163 n=1 Tax=Danaus plexippus TaxID=13037 RepID=UPI002AB22565|nr:putative cysteine proteinase CG12163 [Danaus plexippus]
MSLPIFTYLFCINLVFGLSHCLNSFGDGPLPRYFDWRDHGAVSPVKNQGGCEACWAFSAVACIESHLKIHLSSEEILSEQFLIDCAPGNIGCNSTSVLKTFGTIVNDIGGVLRDLDYKPYEAKQKKCSWDPLKRPIPVVGYRRVKPDEQIMALYVVNVGPLSAAINSASMAKYNGGIDEPTDKLCSPRQTNHAILIVGFSFYEDPQSKTYVPYWIIKNSWGTSWGDYGYYYLVRGRNACGIATDVSYPYVM